MSVGLWLLGAAGFIGFSWMAFTNLQSPPHAAWYMFCAFLALFALGWMGEMLKAVDSIKEALSRRKDG